MVSEADRMRAIERVRQTMESSLGDRPYSKRKRAVYRALKRKDPGVQLYYDTILATFSLMNAICEDMYKDSNEKP